MQSRDLFYQDEARAKLKVGIDALAKMVKVTLGPKGRNVVIDSRFGSPVVTKDGVTVAKQIFLKDPVANMGAQLLKEVASKTAEVAGDGTTTATVLAQYIITEGMRLVTAGANPMDIKRGIDVAVESAVEALKTLSKPVEAKEDIVHVGSISANNDAFIGELIADAMEKVGKEGIITIEDAKGLDTIVETVEGMQFDRGYIHPYFMTRVDTMECVLTNVRFLLSKNRVSDFSTIIPIAEKVASDGESLVVIAEDVDGTALQGLVANRMKGTLRVCAVKAPGFGDRRNDMVDDIALVVGGVAVEEGIGKSLKTLSKNDLGRAEKVIISKDTTVIVGGAGDVDKISERIQQIRTLIEASSSDYDKEKYQERLAKLTGGVAVLRVGAATEAAQKEKKMRIEDALHATRAAVQEGIVPGGGIAYLRLQTAVQAFSMASTMMNDDQKAGVQIIYKALAQPLVAIAENAGQSGEVVLSEVTKRRDATYPEIPLDWGFNALTNQYEPLMKAGVIDPTKVVRSALENAASISGLFLATEGVVAESLEEKEYNEKLMNQAPSY